MKTFIRNTVLSFCLLFSLALPSLQAQTVFWSDDFEAAGSPSSGVRTPTLEDGGVSDPAGQDQNTYFGRSEDTGGNTMIINGNTLNYTDYTGESGAQFWAGENHDDIPANDAVELSIVWTGIAITGLSNMKFAGLFGADDNNNFESDDHLYVEYRIDGGTWTQGLRIERISGASNDWAVDTDDDGDGESPALTEAMQELGFNITGSGNTLELRIRVAASSPDEEWAVDNFRLIDCSSINANITFTETSGVANNDGITCAGATVTLNAGNFASYSWSPGGATDQIIMVNPNTTTTYSVTVTSAGGCTDTDSQQITVNPNPSVNITVDESSAGTNDDGTICSGDPVNLSVGSFDSYSWSPGGANTQSINVNPTSTTGYSVTVTNANGCEGTDSQSITVSAPAAQTLTTTDGGGPFCADGTARTMRMSDTNTGVNYQLKRDGVNVGSPIAGTNNGVNFSPQQTLAGSYTVEATSAATGCKADMVGTVLLVDPAASVDAGPDDEVCRGGSVMLDGTFSGGGGVEWSSSAGGTFSPNDNTLDATFTPPANFNGTITLTLMTTGGSGPCPASEDEMVLTVHPRPNVVITVEENSAGTDDDGVICEGASAVLNAGTFVSYSWSEGNATTQTISVSPALNDTYTVTVTDSNGCTNSDNQAITVRVNPEVEPIEAITIPDGGTATFEIFASPAPLSIDWTVEVDNIDEANSEFDISGTSDEVEGMFTVESGRTFGEAVYTILVDKSGCTVSTTAVVRVFPPQEGVTIEDDPIFIPELLTPNGDGINDEWNILLSGDRLPEEYSVIVRDRTGCVVHEGTLADRFDASKCPNGVFYYIIIDEMKLVTYKGAFSIITTN